MSDYTERKRRYVHDLEAEIERFRAQKCWTLEELKRLRGGWRWAGLMDADTFLDWLEQA